MQVVQKTNSTAFREIYKYAQLHICISIYLSILYYVSLLLSCAHTHTTCTHLHADFKFKAAWSKHIVEHPIWKIKERVQNAQDLPTRRPLSSSFWPKWVSKWASGHRESKLELLLRPTLELHHANKLESNFHATLSASLSPGGSEAPAYLRDGHGMTRVMLSVLYLGMKLLHHFVF